MGTFGVKFEILYKLYNWLPISIISKLNFNLLILVWLDDESNFLLTKSCRLNDGDNESTIYEELSRLHE